MYAEHEQDLLRLLQYEQLEHLTLLWRAVDSGDSSDDDETRCVPAAQPCDHCSQVYFSTESDT